MTVKEQVLSALEEHRGEYLSGSVLANTLHASRNAVWKAIKQLQEQGYLIQAVTNRGYCLSTQNSILSRQSITQHLTVSTPLKIEVLPTVSSTNTVLKQWAEEGAPEGTVLLAEEQMVGRGRRDHSFYSPPGTGIYMSLLLRPTFSASESLCITTCAAVAVCKALEKTAGVSPKIKWVNDIFCNEKKVCGILTEASLDLEGGGLHYAILGIGINVYPPKDLFSPDLDKVATAVFDQPSGQQDDRSKIAADVLNCFFADYPTIQKKSYFEEYRQRSMVLGKSIRILYAGREEDAIALDLDQDFRLKVQLADGSVQFLSSGEVSVKPL